MPFTTHVFLLICVSIYAVAIARVVHVDVNAPWARYDASFTAEISEFLAHESPELFWKYTNSLCAHPSVDDVDHTVAFNTAQSLLAPALHPLLDTVLGLSVYAPTVQFFQSIASNFSPENNSNASTSAGNPCDGNAWAVVYPGRRIACNVQTLNAHMIKSSSGDEEVEGLLQDVTYGHSSDGASWDHTFGVATSASLQKQGSEVHVVVYGAIGSSSFCALHAVASSASSTTADAVSSASIVSTYAVRHAFPGMLPKANSTRLQGFGVFLDIKNMEYKNVDDSSTSVAKEETSSQQTETEEITIASFPEGEQVAGVILSTIIANNPDVDLHDMSVLRDDLIEVALEGGEDEDGDMSHMKLWRMKDLGVQTVHSILKSEDPVTQFAALVHSFPTHASRISSIKSKLTEPVTAAVRTWHTVGASQSLPTNCMFINGRHVPLGGNTFNVYDMLHIVRAELDQVTRLESFAQGRHALSSSDLLVLEAAASGLASAEGKPLVRVDVSRGAKYVVAFLNNIEKDQEYAHWPKKLATLLQPSWQLHQVRRNLYTVVVIADVLTPEGAILVYQFNMMVKQTYPLRVGYVPVCAESIPTQSAGSIPGVNIYGETEAELASWNSERKATGKDICSVFSVVRDKYSGEVAAAFLSAIAQQTVGQQQQRRQVEAALAQLHAAQAAGDVMGSQGGSIEDEIYGYETMLLDLTGHSLKSVTSIYATVLHGRRNEGGIPEGKDVPESIRAVAPANPATKEGFRMEAKAILAASRVPTSDLYAHTAQFQANATSYIYNRGLPVNSYSVNGIVEKSPDIQQVLMQTLSREQHQLTQWAQAGKITDKKSSLFSAILSLSKAYPRYHALLEENSKGEVEYIDTNANGYAMETLLKETQSSYGGYIMSGTDAGYYSTAVLSVPPSRAGMEALHAGLTWLVNIDSTEGGSVEIAAIPPHRLAYFMHVSDSVLSCHLSSAASSSSTESCSASDVNESWYLQIASLLLSLQLQVISAGGSVKQLLKDLNTMLDIVDNEAEPVGILRVHHTLETLPSFIHLNSLPAQQAQVKESTDIKSDVFAKNLHTLHTLTRLAHNAALYSSKVTSSTSDITVMYNGRRLVVPASIDTAVVSSNDMSMPCMSEHDFALLAAVERGRIGTYLEAVMSSVLSSATTETDTVSTQVEDLSNLFLSMHSYCGVVASSSDRHDIHQVLAGLGVTLGEKTSASAAGKLDADSEGLTNLPLSFEVFPVGHAKTASAKSSLLSIMYIVDPLSVAGQRAAALLSLVRDQLQLVQQVILIPRLDIANNEFPLQNFYRYVLGGSAAVDDVSAGRASFKNLPRQHTLTVRIDAPENWNIQSTVAQQDVDNLRCVSKNECGDRVDGQEETSQVTTIGYNLKSILVSGQCFETPTGASAGIFGGMQAVPPNGLQLTLRNTQESLDGEKPVGIVHSDTLVMQNLGYFQLAASSPGLYSLSIAEGRGDELFTIDGSSALHSNSKNSTAIINGKLLAVRSFSDVESSVRITVTKRPGMEALPLLEGGEDDHEDLVFSRTGRRTQEMNKKSTKGGKKGKKDKSKGTTKKGLMNSITSMFSSNSENSKTVDQQVATLGDGKIHVFSLATGHMYERLLRIMMLSVTKRSSMPVKFWLFENFLSPSFKEVAAAMAVEYSFEVGYVTYKWPSWLTQQTQKQRIIWGYKILFLDVLFPLNVQKVIYVDSDQVVRADLKELWDLDLEGKPYAYTPFCTSREETLGFQFWRQGYWNDHLNGNPYHISALYVVDLANFRRNAVGDQLRAIYDGLARDPNSLANLDQDLPNYAQSQVPIHSLPQEWLWCETWCSDSSKKEAKTIDLCNNPLHKEPKLDMARRVISGDLFEESWLELDNEIRDLKTRHGFA